MKYQYDFMIAGISMRWLADFPLKLDERYEAFRISLKEEPEVVYEIKCGEYDKDISHAQVLFESDYYQISQDDEYRYRTYFYKKEFGQIVTLVRKIHNGKKWCLYIPKTSWQEFHYAKNWTFYMAFEEFLSENNRMLLHASYVETEEGAILFSGPSGIGKSTQAKLWSEYQSAKIINGDRTVLYEKNGSIFAAGSPCAGTSNIYQNYHSRIRAIVILNQGKENKIKRLKGRECLIPLIRESNFPYMDEKMRNIQLDLYCLTEKQIPIYSFQCKKDKSAVDALYEALKKDIKDTKGGTDGKSTD